MNNFLKTPIYKYSRIVFNSQCSSYHVNCRLLGISKLNIHKGSKLPTNYCCLNTLLTRHIWQDNPCLGSFYTVQKRNFSFKDSFESAVYTHSSFFKFLSESSVVQYTQTFIVNLHDTTGSPWWLSIILVTLLFRSCITFPLALYQSYVIARLENVRKEMDEIVNDLRYDLDREIRKQKWSQKKAKAHFNTAVRKEWKRLIERDNCHPAKISILAIIQIPTWIVISTAIRNMVYMLPHQDSAAMVTKLGLSLGGVAWCPDLTVSDSFVIPITLGLVNLAIIEIQSMMHKGQKSRLQRYVTNFFRGFTIFLIPVCATVPSAVSLYWLTSSMMGLCQNLVILSPRVRRIVGIPSTPSYNPHPYTHLAQQIKSKFRW